jgi:hypothetical protein
MDLSFLTIGTKYPRPELAQRWGYKSHHALSRGVVTPQGEKILLLFVTRIKQETLTQYRDYISGDLLFWEGQERHGTDDRIIILLNAVRRNDAPSQFVFRLEHDQGAADDIDRFRGEIDAIPDITERKEMRKARVGQGRFRQVLLELWGSRCAVTGVEMPSLLTASHIKPWRSASNAERLDPHNGLLVLPQYDRLFDRGFISFSDDGHQPFTDSDIGSALAMRELMETLRQSGAVTGGPAAMTPRDRSRFLSKLDEAVNAIRRAHPRTE